MRGWSAPSSGQRPEQTGKNDDSYNPADNRWPEVGHLRPLGLGIVSFFGRGKREALIPTRIVNSRIVIAGLRVQGICDAIPAKPFPQKARNRRWHSGCFSQWAQGWFKLIPDRSP